MKRRLQQALEKLWYELPEAPLVRCLEPLENLFITLAARRRRQLSETAFYPEVPVVVIGNITVGGTGKTPLTLRLAEALHQRGWRPGIVSRGYGASRGHFPRFVQADTPASEGGDEPVMLASAGWPVVIDPDRVRAVQHLLSHTDCNLVISDDGLQHYRLGSNVAIAVVDGARGFGNRRCLPAGPLREPVARLGDVDFVVLNGEEVGGFMPPIETVPMHVQPGGWLHLASGDMQPLEAGPHRGRVHAVAGIGNPSRFFASLRALGFTPVEHAFADHYRFTASDFHFDETLPILMTTKDAVKCRHLNLPDAWALQVQASVPDAFLDAVHQTLSLSRKRR